MDGQSFSNPVFASQDPYIVQWEGNYYYSDSDGSTIYVRTSATLSGLKLAAPRAVWTASGLANVWAPEIHQLNGQWYMYFAADYQSDGRHRLYVLQGGAHPLDPYEFAGQITESTGLWAIDPDVFYGPDQALYLTWSCTSDNVGKMPQALCIARMSDPLHVASSTVQISFPTEPWETRTAPIQEGPVGFVREGSTYLTYSASASWTTNDYAAGVLMNSSGDLLNPDAWTKRGPILDGHSNAYGPGSVVFTSSPDGSEWWSLYHAYDRLDCAQWACRSIRMQKMTWGADGLPVVGYAMNPEVTVQAPSGDAGLWGWGDGAGTPASGGLVYLSSSSVNAEAAGRTGQTVQQAFRSGPNSVAYTVSADLQGGSAARYGLYAVYSDAANHVEAFLDSRLGAFGSAATVNGADLGTHLQALPSGFDFTAAHGVKVVKSAAGQFTFYLDATALEQRSVDVGRGQIGVLAKCGSAQFRNLAVTDDAFGWGDAFGDAAEGATGGAAQGLWNIGDAGTVDSMSTDAGWHTLFRGNPNLGSFTVQAEAQQDAAGSGADPRFGLMVCYDDRNNQVSMWVDPVQQMVWVNGVARGDSEWRNAGLPAGFDATAFHTLSATKAGTLFVFLVDGTEVLRTNFNLVNGMPGVATDGTQAHFRNFTVSQ